MTYKCIRDFDNIDHPYFKGDVITKKELELLTQKEALNFENVDTVIDLFPIEYYDDYTDEYMINN